MLLVFLVVLLDLLREHLDLFLEVVFQDAVGDHPVGAPLQLQLPLLFQLLDLILSPPLLFLQLLYLLQKPLFVVAQCLLNGGLFVVAVVEPQRDFCQVFYHFVVGFQDLLAHIVVTPLAWRVPCGGDQLLQDLLHLPLLMVSSQPPLFISNVKVNLLLQQHLGDLQCIALLLQLPNHDMHWRILGVTT